MKQLTTYNRAAAYLNSIFDLLNERYFESALSRPIITIQSTPKAYGHYTLYDAWSVDGDKGMREINIGAGTLSRPIENVVATLLHEMVHYWNDTNGIKDASRGNTYHNKNFKVKAEACDLIVEHHDTYGWSKTSPSDALVEVSPAPGVELEIESAVMAQFGDAIEKCVREVLAQFAVEGAAVRVTDRGALDCTIRARVEAAVKRAAKEDA